MGQVAAGTKPGNILIACYDIFPGFDKLGLGVWGSCLLFVLFIFLLICYTVAV